VPPRDYYLKSMFMAGLQVAKDATIATGLDIVQPLAVVAHTAVGARLHVLIHAAWYLFYRVTFVT
jgi:hypothetical protein